MPRPVPTTQTGSLTDNQHGTNDTLIGVDPAVNDLYGDALSMFDSARGGNDTVIGGPGASKSLSWGRPFHVRQYPGRQRHADRPAEATRLWGDSGRCRQCPRRQ